MSNGNGDPNLLDPLGTDSNGWQGNAQQSDYRVPIVASNVGTAVVGANPLGLSWPLSRYVQPGINGPNGTFAF